MLSAGKRHSADPSVSIVASRIGRKISVAIAGCLLARRQNVLWGTS